MKKYLLLLWASGFSFLCFAQHQDMAASVKSKFAPDRRTAVFDVNIIERGDTVILKGETNIADARDKLLSEIIKLRRPVTDSITLLPVTKNDKYYAVATVSVASLRNGPGYAAEMATQMIMGQPLKVLDGTGSWIRVQTPESYIAWVSGSSLKLMTKDEFNEYIAKPKLIFMPEYGKCYEKANEKSQQVSDLVAGSLLVKLGPEGRFIKIQLPDGRIGYVKKSEAADYDKWRTSVKATAESIIETAKRFMGVPYLWGGTSSKMLDCSGLAKTVYYLNGIILMRDASQQCLTGEPVDVSDGYKNLRAGDLVFFGSRPERITHVGIYMGDGDFIHEAGKVHISSFNPDSPYYSRYYVGALKKASRIIGMQDKGSGVWSLAKNELYNIQQ